MMKQTNLKEKIQQVLVLKIPNKTLDHTLLMDYLNQQQSNYFQSFPISKRSNTSFSHQKIDKLNFIFIIRL